MSDLKKLIKNLKEEMQNGLKKDKAKTSGDHASNDHVSGYRRDLARAAGLQGIFGHANTGFTFR